MESGEETLVGDPSQTSPPNEPPDAASDELAQRPITGSSRRAHARDQGLQLQRGDRVGRYTVLELLGRGGMGLVYAAYDPQLDRRVAVKVLRSRGSAGQSERAQQRLLREAQAMAKLSHPNVVAVHDVGTVEGVVFIAMESIDGPSLDRWLEQRPRPWHEVVRVLAEAGQGLAAAHAAGMVHRDFKPANVLIDAAGRARVTDFGLAHVSDPSTAAPSDPELIEASPVQTMLTDGNALLGTPAYMAPEQHARTGVDGRTDQFGFCVALYEALFHQHPFGGDTVIELASAVSAGRLREVPGDAPVPAHVRRAVLRGLAQQPNERWPSMEALLAALLDDPARRRRRWLGTAAVVGVVAGAAALGLQLRPEPIEAPPPCAGAGDELERVWSPARRDAIAQAFAATRQPHAITLWSRSADVIDRYGERWRGSARDACEAPRVRGEQSDTLFDLRRACLGRRLHELDARLQVLTRVDASMLDRTVEVATSLTPVDVCEDTRHLVETVPLPEDPRQAEQVEALVQRLGILRASLAAGRAAAIEDEVDEAVTRAELLGHAPTRADARRLASAVKEELGHWKEAEALLRRAAEDAGEGRDDRQLAAIWAEMPYLVGYLQARFSDAELLIPVGRAALARAGRPDDLVVGFEQGIGTMRFRQGDREAARRHYEAALTRLHEHEGQALRRATVLNNLGVLHMLDGDYPAARAWLERAHDAREGLQPPDHPDQADHHQNLGNLAAGEADFRGALRHYDQALEILRKAQPDGGAAELSLLINRAHILTALHRPDDARADLERALQLAERLYGADHPVGYAAWGAMAHLERSLERFDEARTAIARALELGRAALGPEHHDLGALLAEHGAIELDAGEPTLAAERLEQALAHLEAGYGPEHPQTGIVLRWRGAAELAQGRLAPARERLERAVEILERHHGDARELARGRFDLARCLPEADRARARRLATQARERLAADLETDEVAAIDAWLARTEAESPHTRGSSPAE